MNIPVSVHHYDMEVTQSLGLCLKNEGIKGGGGNTATLKKIYFLEHKGHLNFPHLADSVFVRTTRYSPVAAHPERFCRPCPGRTDGKQLGEKINKSHVNLIELCESLGTQPCDGAVHSQSSLFVLLLRGSLAEAFLFFSLSSIGLK